MLRAKQKKYNKIKTKKQTEIPKNTKLVIAVANLGLFVQS